MAPLREMLIRAFERAGFRSYAALAKQIGISRETASRLGRWDPTSNEPEPGLRMSNVDRWFAACGVEVVEIDASLIGQLGALPASHREAVATFVRLLDELRTRDPDLANDAANALKAQASTWQKLVGGLEERGAVQQNRGHL